MDFRSDWGGVVDGMRRFDATGHEALTDAAVLRVFPRGWRAVEGVVANIVAEHGLAGRQVAVNDALDGLAQKGLTKIRVALRPRPDGFLEVVG
jgi:hypothetical protein